MASLPGRIEKLETIRLANQPRPLEYVCYPTEEAYQEALKAGTVPKGPMKTYAGFDPERV